ncbi:hypothetical protein H2248_002556 [Termitomyces sp. 'cryptogamus']|nr:hypothetical protein H2248_007987 [Termitomyces sp. 'cryptogamus']KAH0579715.1 hypothetical protein H2248_002555 [Termitomyces sp. 'cryptogamus']KAH0579716.1 hypothetical protein H2248_002556 [Termitomyces sp. 'cryptogamus']
MFSPPLAFSEATTSPQTGIIHLPTSDGKTTHSMQMQTILLSTLVRPILPDPHPTLQLAIPPRIMSSPGQTTKKGKGASAGLLHTQMDLDMSLQPIGGLLLH